MAPHERYQPTREEWEELRNDVSEIKIALKGNDMGTRGVIARLLDLESWRDEARLKLALIATGIAGGATATIEAVKHFFTGSPPGH